MVIAGGVIPSQDYQFLHDAGVVAIFGPGSSVASAGRKIMEILIAARS
jgi:methylmalonyl-CoA mutase